METILRDVNTQAVVQASKALSQLINRQVDVEILHADVKKVANLMPLIDPEEMVAGIYLPVSGDANGATLLIFPRKTTVVLSELLIKKEPGTTHTLSELDKSALKEVGNIVSGNYLTVLANVLQIKLVEHTPHFSFDMFGAILSHVITNFATQTDKALVVEVRFAFKSGTFLRSYLLLLFEAEQFESLINSLAELKRG